MIVRSVRARLSIALLVLASCGGDNPFGTRSEATLRGARALWESRQIDSYEITFRALCFCGFVDPVRVRVENGAIVSRIVVATGDPLAPQFASSYPDVPGLFAVIERAHTDGADVVDAAFDESYGFPTGIWIDWKESWADDEIGYRTESFVVLP